MRADNRTQSESMSSSTTLSRWLLLMALFFGCDSFQVGSLVQSGRQALLKKNFDEALGYFEQAAKKDPSYVYQSAHFSEGIWTYVGRSQYVTGRYQVARQSLEHSLKTRPDDHVARLYLGLALVRSANGPRGLGEIQNGLQGLFDWIEDIIASRPFEAYWDPNKQIRNELKKTIALIADANADGAKIIAASEWLGQEIEEEIERARRDESQQH
jgi:tetratricopeptide (TPR) repeat protein